MNFHQRADQIIEEHRQNHKKRMAHLNERTMNYDEPYFEKKLEEICNEAGGGSGLIYEYYVEKISKAIDRYVQHLLPDTREQVLKMAEKKFDYCCEDELKEDQDWYAENGYCTHGLDPYCCPAGCGEG